MLLIGKNIKTPGDQLQAYSVEKIYKALTNPNGEIVTLLQRLQQIRIIDPNQYRKLKTGLPYMVCADFFPKVRKKENFLSTERFLIDIDHLSEYQLDISELKEKLKTNPSIELLFISPSGDGLKALFKLSEKITDSAYYALFFKSFCLQFAKEYQLGAAVDIKTNDVSRCCFVSYDPDTYYNPEPVPIIAEKYLTSDSFEAFDQINYEIKKEESALKIQEKEAGVIKENPNKTLPDDILHQIKIKVGQRVKDPIIKEYIQPEELDAIIESIQEQLAEINVELVSSEPINYGRRLRVKAEIYWAEINIFLGKRNGVTVVPTTKTGSKKELAEMVTELLRSTISI